MVGISDIDTHKMVSIHGRVLLPSVETNQLPSGLVFHCVRVIYAVSRATLSGTAERQVGRVWGSTRDDKGSECVWDCFQRNLSTLQKCYLSAHTTVISNF